MTALPLKLSDQIFQCGCTVTVWAGSVLLPISSTYYWALLSVHCCTLGMCVCASITKIKVYKVNEVVLSLKDFSSVSI